MRTVALPGVPPMVEAAAGCSLEMGDWGQSLRIFCNYSLLFLAAANFGLIVHLGELPLGGDEDVDREQQRR